jgi:hypothetical protein
METYGRVIWQDNMTYRLEHWKEEYSKDRLSVFIDYGLMGANHSSAPLFSKIVSEISDEAHPERELKWKNNNK